MMNEMKNLFLEIPHHVETGKGDLEDLITNVFSGEETKRGVDYRKALIKVYIYCNNISFSLYN